jgi:cell division protein FtsX
MTQELLKTLSDLSIGVLALLLLVFVLKSVFSLALQALASKEKIIMELIKLLEGKFGR